MIYDISQSLFECNLFPGDSLPEKKILARLDDGGDCNLTGISMCVHNGTHVDAPFHFLNDGKGIDQVALEKFIGPAYVVSHEGDVTSEDAQRFINDARMINPEAAKKLLIKGNATVTLEAANVFADYELDLVGNESQTVGPLSSPREVHLTLLKKEIVLLEGLKMDGIKDGVYLLNCAPLNLKDTDGSPCRAVLMDL